MSRSLGASLSLTGALLVLGCSSGPQSGGQIGGETTGCQPVKTSDLGVDDVSPLGFSANDVLAATGGSHEAPLVWAKGGSTAVSVTLQYDGGAVQYLDREWKDDGSGREIAADCPDVVVIASTLGFTTTDGAFAESWPVKMEAATAESASLTMAIDVDALKGTYRVTEVDPAGYDGVRVFLDVALDANGTDGTIAGQGSKCEGSDPDAACSATAFDIATFATP